MQEAQNTQVVQDAYAAFGRGDIAAILASLADDIQWNGVYGAASHVPTSGERRGRQAVSEFFDQVAANFKFSRFEPKEFIATGDRVVALGHYTATTPANKTFDSDFAMVFTLRNGKVVEFQEFCNSAGLNEAFTASAARAGA